MLRDFLRFVVEKTLSGLAQEIKGYTVATEVFGRNADFDAAKDTIVRIQAGRLRRALERYYLTIGRQDLVRIDILKGSYVPTFHLAAREETGVEVSTAALDEAVLTLPSGPSVAVMPLLNLTGDRRQEFFADGLAEEITNELARYQDLRVIAFQSTLRWKGVKLDAREVGRDLNIRFFLEGSIRKEARLIKITVRLVDTVNGMQVWGDQYQRQLRPDKLIALQEEIAQKVAAKIGSEYGIIPRNLSKESRKKPPESLDTYEAFLRFYQHVTDLDPRDLRGGPPRSGTGRYSGAGMRPRLVPVGTPLLPELHAPILSPQDPPAKSPGFCQEWGIAGFAEPTGAGHHGLSPFPPQ